MGYNLNQSTGLRRRPFRQTATLRDISAYDLSAVALATRELARRSDPPPKLESLYDSGIIARINAHFRRA